MVGPEHTPGPRGSLLPRHVGLYGSGGTREGHCLWGRRDVSGLQWSKVVGELRPKHTSLKECAGGGWWRQGQSQVTHLWERQEREGEPQRETASEK